MNFGPFSGGRDESEFDDLDSFVPDHLPDPGPFLEDATALTDEAHVAVHRTSHELFEERGVYDMTFGYNLAELNLDPRHPDAGFRYAEADDGTVLRAEFTPTTAFCPQSDTLATGAFRAWNGLADRHDYKLVRVRVDWMHHRSDSINDQMRELEAEFGETGEVPTPDADTTDETGDSAGETDGPDHADKVRERLRSGDGGDEPDVMYR
jgi:hypothetical protein